MAEQGTYTATNLPIDGSNPVAAQITTDANGLINEFNKQVPLTKISAEQAWISFAPTITGFSANPTIISFYEKVGRRCTVSNNTTGTGTSNATTWTQTLPFASARTVSLTSTGTVRDNGTNLTAPARIDLVAGSNIATLYKDLTGAAWTASSTKLVDFTITYETQT